MHMQPRKHIRRIDLAQLRQNVTLLKQSLPAGTQLLAVVKEVMSREELKYCPHGRPICVTLSKKQLEKQFKRS